MTDRPTDKRTDKELHIQKIDLRREAGEKDDTMILNLKGVQQI